MSDAERGLRDVLTEARALGYLGPGEIDVHLAHARGFVATVESVLGGAPTSFLDLGTGGGVPGLVLAAAWPGAEGRFVDSNVRRCSSLRSWVAALGLTVEVIEGRAEAVARDPLLRQGTSVVTARGFGPPPATAEVAAGLVALDGILVVSEPPGGDQKRWDDDGLARLGFGPATILKPDTAAYAVIRKVSPVPDRFPRRAPGPWKRPLW